MPIDRPLFPFRQLRWIGEMPKGHIEQEQQGQSKTQQASSSQGQAGSGGSGKGGKALAKTSAEATRAAGVTAAAADADATGGASALATTKGDQEVEGRKRQDEAGARRKGEWMEHEEEKEGGGEDEEKEIREEDVAQLYDDEAQLCEMPEARDPKLFVRGLTLRRYQRQALAWMIEREKKRYVTEEDCTGLSMGRATAGDSSGAGVAEVCGTSGGKPASAGGSPGTGESSGGGGGQCKGVFLRDGRIRVASWDRSATDGAGGADYGGGAGVAMHPLWERRAAASRVAVTAASASTCSSGGLFDLAGEGGVVSSVAAGGDHTPVLAQPEMFFVNIYSRRFQREFPPASLGCRGGILADEMGMGKVRGGSRASTALFWVAVGGARRGADGPEWYFFPVKGGERVAVEEDLFVDWSRCKGDLVALGECVALLAVGSYFYSSWHG